MKEIEFLKNARYKQILLILLIVGAIYCKNPNKDKGIFCAPFAKYNSGTAVAAPAPINNKSVSIPADKKELEPLKNKYDIYIAATGVTTKVSNANRQQSLH